MHAHTHTHIHTHTHNFLPHSYMQSKTVFFKMLLLGPHRTFNADWQNTCRHQIWMRQNGGSLNFVFCFFFVTKSCGRQELGFTNILSGIVRENDAMYDWNFLWTANSLNVSHFDSFICSLLNCEYHCSQVTPPLLAVCSLILDYAVHTFSTTGTKYIMFRVGWRKSLKASMTPDYLVPLLADSKLRKGLFQKNVYHCKEFIQHIWSYHWPWLYIFFPHPLPPSVTWGGGGGIKLPQGSH